jgi:predicted ATPase/DNA-binding SARP family transcriptional activator
MAGALQDVPSTVANQRLTVKLLGPPHLKVADTPVALPRRQMRALLYRLAATLQPVAREHLYFLLWPDIPDAAARRNLTVLLNQLRQALPSPSAIRSQGDALMLDPATFYVDTAAFMEMIVAAPTLGELEPIANAVKLYSGPFLDGFSLPSSNEFDDWAAQERRIWERRYLDALAMLVDGYAGRGAYEQAIAVAQQALAVDELAEEMHRWLITLYATVGDRSAALRQFERCVVVLERELAVSPLPETRAVYEAVRDGNTPLHKPAQAPVPQPHQVTLQPSQTIAATNGAGQADGTRAKPHVSLPVATTPLIGRQPELADLSRLLADPSVRLLTLLGPGGSGKTRLALQAAWDASEHFVDGTIFVPLAPLRDANLVLLTIGYACGMSQVTPEALAAHLHGKKILLVLDNCEHVLAAAPEIAALLSAAPGLRILATSRATLNLQGERLFAVSPLPLPDLAHLPPVSVLANVPAVALLLARTQALNPRFQLTAQNATEIGSICVRLDGLPLAIELAAARLKLLPPRDLLRRLDRRLPILTYGSRDLPERHQTLRATIDWSYRLLDIDEQIWFERCSVFIGEWTLEAVEGLDERLRWRSETQHENHSGASNHLDILTSLIDKSLLQVRTDAADETRFSMLETIREFAAERLQQRGSALSVHQAHADYYLNLVEPWDMNATGWIASIERELGNLLAALRWYMNSDEGMESALRLSKVLGRFWYWRDWISEARWWLEQLVEKSEGIRSELRAHLLNGTAIMAVVQGDAKRAIELNEAALELSRELGLTNQVASSLNSLGTIFSRQGDVDRAVAYYEEGLAAGQQDVTPQVQSNLRYMLAGTLIDAGQDYPRALALYEECLAISRQHKLLLTESMTLAALGVAYAFTGELARAGELLPEALRMQREMNNTMAIGWTLQFLALLEYFRADYPAAEHYFFESLSMTPQGGAQYIVPVSLEGLAGILSLRQRPAQAARLLGAAEALREAIQHQRAPVEKPLYSQILASVQAQLPEQELREQWQSGRKLSSAQAIAEARSYSDIGHASA